MGCLNSKPSEEREKGEKDIVLDIKLLLLGAGESGKSTVVKQLKLIHKIEIDERELQLYKETLQQNTIESMIAFVEAVKKLNYTWESEELKAIAERVQTLEIRNGLNKESAEDITRLWRSETIKKVFKERHRFWNLDASDFYFDNALRFAQPDYKPTEEDCILARVRTTGVTTTEFDEPPFHLLVQDVGGQRSERKKWVQCFENVRGVIYVVNLVSFNQVLFEAEENRMGECLELFKTVANNQLFEKVPIFLFLNKKDLFEKMLQEGNSIKSFYKNYSGPDDVRSCIDYIKEDFLSKVDEPYRKKIHVFEVAARYRKDIKYCFDEIKKILSSELKEEIKEAKKKKFEQQ